MSTQYLTKAGQKELREELEKLKGPVRKEIAKRLKSAIEMGDLSENAEYIATKEEQGFIEGRILEIEYTLSEAVLIEENNGNTDTVIVGAKITIQEEDFPEEIFHLVGSKEADPGNGRISNESPIGQALIGKKVGDNVSVQTPGGTLYFKILKIE
ncbi:MAG: transcription elongation factor GreA [Anaerolineales bacterium]|nr:transcription elongation factor GreA [Chloroflexota bacterium]MBL6982081.1 transcription elongation factor GreA [Anaerolineales bacterium]